MASNGYRIGTARGAGRLWIEGKAVESKLHLSPGDRFDVVVQADHTIAIVGSPTGRYKTSHKTSRKTGITVGVIDARVPLELVGQRYRVSESQPMDPAEKFTILDRVN
jgi:FtsP/CotA-like multicopper oxidase with cupredoxin domain